MLDLRLASLISVEDLSPGDLVVPVLDGLRAPHLISLYAGQPFSMSLGPGDRAFQAVPAMNLQSTLLRVVDWRLEVDRATAFGGGSDELQVGDAYITANGQGWLGRTGYSELFVNATAPSQASISDYRHGFVGFRRWRIVVDQQSGLVELCSHERTGK